MNFSNPPIQGKSYIYSRNGKPPVAPHQYSDTGKNQGIDHVVALLRDMGKFPFADKNSMQCAIVEIKEVRCDMNADFTEHLADSERLDEGHFWKQRRAFEKKWRDPDDVYIDVERREEERKKQGLPPRLGILPYSAVAEEVDRWEADQGRKKERSKKRGK